MGRLSFAVPALRKLMEQFPQASSSALARMAYQRFPEYFTSVERARERIRYIRGASGKFKRQHIADKSQFRRYDALPEGLREIPDWSPVSFTGPLNAIVLGDLHIPYHHKPSLVLALESAKKRQVDMVLLNGDTLDCHAVSWFQKDPRERDFPGELTTTRAFLSLVRDKFPKARVIYKIGNHEERWENYMFQHAPELLDVEDFQLESLLRLKDYGVELVKDKRRIMLGKLYVLHGHEFHSGLRNTVSPARTYFLRGKALCLCSHSHQTSQHSESDLEEKVVSTWSTGCCCDLHPRWWPINNWNHGFAFVEVDKRGAFTVSNKRIVDGQVY